MTLVWVLLVVALVTMLAVFTIVLIRKAFSAVQAFSDLVGRTAILDGVHRSEPQPRPLPAVLGSTSEPSARWRAVRNRRTQRRQQRHRARIARGNHLVRTDAASIEWFHR